MRPLTHFLSLIITVPETTIKDTIEFVYRERKSIFTQREIGVTSNSYSSALMNALREDPDVILVGEMRDVDTIEKVLKSVYMYMLIRFYGPFVFYIQIQR